MHKVLILSFVKVPQVPPNSSKDLKMALNVFTPFHYGSFSILAKINVKVLITDC